MAPPSCPCSLSQCSWPPRGPVRTLSHYSTHRLRAPCWPHPLLQSTSNLPPPTAVAPARIVRTNRREPAVRGRPRLKLLCPPLHSEPDRLIDRPDAGTLGSIGPVPDSRLASTRR